METLRALFGYFDENIGLIETELGVRIHQADSELLILGAPVQADAAVETIKHLMERVRRGEPLDRTAIKYVIEGVREGSGEEIAALMKDVVAMTFRGKQIRAKTLGQKKYIAALKSSTVTFCVGPAGTGKTYLAIAQAVMALKNKEVQRLVLTRPAVEAGERLGFLPGDLQQKVDPYLRPLYDALQDLLGYENFVKHQERGIIEVAPLAYMRGRTLNDSYIILDEAQNCTREQMKMFLTRFGEGSRIVVTGDVTQIDLPPERTSGLIHATRVLEGVEGISFCSLDQRDVVRHDIVRNIIRAYEKYEKRESGSRHDAQRTKGDRP
ncbi:MAG: PhoH family protein [Clostridia bacterium]|nr:PhoH family protein [Clostridia bacterium]